MTLNIKKSAILYFVGLSLGNWLTCYNIASANCGEIIQINTHDKSTTRYALQQNHNIPSSNPPAALLLLVGGGGFLDLANDGCAVNLSGNFLIRALPQFQAKGFITAVVDAPSDYQGEDGLGSFRMYKDHALDIALVIKDLKLRTHAQVWIVSNSRGTLSAANAAARIPEDQLPDGVVLTSALMQGANGRKAWVANSVFDLPLEDIHIPLLLIGHAEDKCVRTPPGKMERLLKKIGSKQKQMVIIEGGPGYHGPGGLDACKGRAPHGFIDQEQDIVDGISRFIQTAKY